MRNSNPEIEIGNFGGSFPPAVKWLLVSIGALHFMNIFTGRPFDVLFGLSPSGIREMYLWQCVTYMFVHGDIFWHIFWNAVGLILLGPGIERAIGTRQFLKVFFVSGVLGGLGWLLISLGAPARCVGASGAIFGLIGLLAALFPNQQMYIIFIPVPFKAWVLAVAIGLIQVVSMLVSFGENIAYATHIFGGLAGYGYGYLFLREQGGGQLMASDADAIQAQSH